MRSGKSCGLSACLWTALLASAATATEWKRPDGVTDGDWSEIIRQCDELEGCVARAAGRARDALDADRAADVAVYLKGVRWALKYEQKLEAKDVALLKKSLARGLARAQRADAGTLPAFRPGRSVRGFASAIDDSTQPYGLIVPSGYSAERSLRLDVVLHGSTRPVGLSELRFMERFDGGDVADANEKVPDVDYLELHPLGRVENGYRWAGETDVYEAIEAVCRRYRVDRARIVLRGMSMGTSGTWHLGLKRPDRFVALGPYCGYVDTHRFSETPLPNFVKVGRLPDVQEKTLRLLDSVDYAANAGVVPAIACMGEKDVFFDAHVIMAEAMRREGLAMVNLISPGTGHVIDPTTHAEQMRRIAEIAGRGLDRAPRRIRFVTWSLKYADCHWVRLERLGRHYERAELDVSVDDAGDVRATEPVNVTRFVLRPPVAPGATPRLWIGGREIPVPARSAGEAPVAWRVERRDGTWRADRSGDGESEEGMEGVRSKRPGLQGPIDDAFTAPFLCVYGTGEPWNAAVDDWAQREARRFAAEWERFFRGRLRMKADRDVVPEDLAKYHLIAFGDPGSNRWIREALPELSIQWTPRRLVVAGKDYASADHAPALITASPLPGARGRYLVINSGHTFHEPELSTLNYLLFPRSGDWGVWKVGPQPELAAAGLADEQWRIAP